MGTSLNVVWEIEGSVAHRVDVKVVGGAFTDDLSITVDGDVTFRTTVGAASRGAQVIHVGRKPYELRWHWTVGGSCDTLALFDGSRLVASYGDVAIAQRLLHRPTGLTAAGLIGTLAALSFAIGAIGFAGWIFLGALRQPLPPPPPVPRQASYAPPISLLSETLVVEADSWQSRGFNLPARGRVALSVAGIRDTAKGFDVIVMDAAEAPAFRTGGQYRSYAALSRPQTSSFEQATILEPGSYVIVVRNSRNIINSLAVRVAATVAYEASN